MSSTWRESAMSITSPEPTASSRAGTRAFAALLTGIIFGLGLAVAQMTNPNKVLNFLDIAGAWDASLLLVLGGAVVVATLGYHWVLKLQTPLLDDDFHLPASRVIDAPLVAGAAIFGIGWGLGGYCPGPALSSLGFGNAEALWFLPAMVLGAGLQRWLARPVDDQ
jgi:uncharacterized membrane protein YedE/YeeE